MQVPTILGLLHKFKDIFKTPKSTANPIPQVSSSNYDLDLILHFYIISLDKFTNIDIYDTNGMNNNLLESSIKTINLAYDKDIEINKIIHDCIGLSDYALEIKNSEMSNSKNITFGTLPEDFLSSLMDNLMCIYKLIYFNINLTNIIENPMLDGIEAVLENAVSWVVKYELTEAFKVAIEGKS